MQTQSNPLAKAIKPYEIVESGKTSDEVLSVINAAVYNGHGPDIRARGGVVGILNDPVFQYERLLRDLVAIDGFEGIPFRELLKRRPNANERLCVIRHDIDIDIRAALDLAALEQQYGIRSTWFVLHTAPYYGEFDGKQFNRHSSMIHVYKQLQDMGHEIALHTDGLLVYQQYQLDGATAITSELEWLRANGIEIVGTTAHNSAPIYGAENYEIFKRSPDHPLPFPGEQRDETVLDGRWAPLGVLDEAELGIEYEANDIFWQDEVSVAYAATRGVNRWRWDSESSKGYRRKNKIKRSTGFISYEELITNLRAADSGNYICLAVHPVYYGARHSSISGPTANMSRRRVFCNPKLGWTTYVPGEIQADCASSDGRQEFQALNVADKRGMLAVPRQRPETEVQHEILILGGGNVDGLSCGAEAQMHAEIERSLNEAPNGSAGSAYVTKLAHSDIGLARYYGWYRAISDELTPTTVVLGIGADELSQSMPEYWSRRLGFSPEFPPGMHLSVDPLGEITVNQASASAGFHQTRADPDFYAPSLTNTATHETPEILGSQVETLERIVEFFVTEIQQRGITPIFLVQECGESEGIWNDAQNNRSAIEGAHQNFMSWLGPIAERLGVAIADPYGQWLRSQVEPPMHWRARCEWNYVGHRIAAQELLGVIRSFAASDSQAEPSEDSVG